MSDVSEKDEISIFDLLVVVLKHWKMIVVSTFVTILLVIISYFVLPNFFLSIKKKENLPVITYSVMPSDNYQRIMDGKDLITLAFNNPEIVLDSLIEAGYTEMFEENLIVNREKSLYYVKHILIDHLKFNGDKILEKDIKYSISKGSNNLYNIVFKTEETEKGKLFLNILFSKVEQNLKLVLVPFAQAKKDQYDNLIPAGIDPSLSDSIVSKIITDTITYEKTEDSSKAIAQALIQERMSYSISSNFLKEPNSVSLLNLVNPIVSYSPSINNGSIKSDILKYGVILIFAVFFFSLLIAFIKNAIDEIKKDPIRMQIVNNALGRAKK